MKVDEPRLEVAGTQLELSKLTSTLAVVTHCAEFARPCEMIPCTHRGLFRSYVKKSAVLLAVPADQACPESIHGVLCVTPNASLTKTLEANQLVARLRDSKGGDAFIDEAGTHLLALPAKTNLPVPAKLILVEYT